LPLPVPYHRGFWGRVPDVLPATVVVMVAGGMLLVAMGVHLLNGLRERPDLSPLASIAGWAAASVLLIGALLVWGGTLPVLESFVPPFDLSAWHGPVLPTVLMAALAIPVGGETDPCDAGGRVVSWTRALLVLPAFVLTLALLLQVSSSTASAHDAEWVTPLRFSLAVCAGLGARGLGQALQVLAGGGSSSHWPRTLTYSLLTLVSGSAMLVNLWQQGTVWGGAGPEIQGGLAGTWLVWSASGLAPGRQPQLRAVLTAVAALLLMAVAIGGA